MKQHDWVAAAKHWFEALPDESIARNRAESWNGFAGQSRPVLTIFGSYDTGKSALLRRLLVDDGITVPEWVTISAKPETEKVSHIEALGCLIRDTPGISARNDALRGSRHNAASYSAIGLTDAALVIVNPQLATEELEALRHIVQREWPPGALLLVVGRFDDAGIDPEDAPDAYRDLAERKEAELRASLGIGSDVPVFVVAQDPFQMAGAVVEPDPTIWDDCRGWDGMAALSVAIQRIGTQDDDLFRSAAERRFWQDALNEAKNQLESQLIQHERAKTLSSQVTARRKSWLDQLEHLDTAARESAHAEVQEAVRGALATQDVKPEQTRKQVEDALSLWWRRNVVELDRIWRDVDSELQRAEGRPGWEFLETLTFATRPSPTAAEGTTDGKSRVDDVKTLATKLVEGMTTYRAIVREAEPARSSPRAKVQEVLRKPKKRALNVDAALDAGPQAIDALGQLVSFAEELRNNRAADHARRAETERLDAEADRIARAAVREALPDWQKLVDQVRDSIISATQGEMDVLASLDDLIPLVKEWIHQAEGLLATHSAG